MAHHTNEEIEVLPGDYDLTLAADGGNEDMQQSTAIRLPSDADDDADELSMIGAPSSSKKKYVVGATVLGIVAVTAVAFGVVSSNENKTSNVSSSINAMENNAFVAGRSSKGSKSSSSKSGKSSSSYSRSNKPPTTPAPTMSPMTSAPTLAPTSSPMTSVPTTCFGADGNDLMDAAVAYMEQNCTTTPGCAVENTYGPIEDWCTGAVTDMSDVFNAKDNADGNLVFETFNADISGWDVSNVQTFEQMFRKAQIFDADLSGWNVSSAKNFEQMFRSSESFNADISSWDLSSATSFNAMFRGAQAFDQDLTIWADYFVPDVGNFKDMFRGSGISQNLCSWDSTFPYGVNVENMFSGSNCQNQTSPIEEVGGPFCDNCIP